MVPALQDHEAVAVDAVHEAVFLGDPARPASAEDVSQGLWFAGAGVGSAKGLPQQIVDPLQELPVGLLPVEVVLPSIFVEANPHQ